MAKEEAIIHVLRKELATVTKNFKNVRSQQASMKTIINIAKWDVKQIDNQWENLKQSLGQEWFSLHVYFFIVCGHSEFYLCHLIT